MCSKRCISKMDRLRVLCLLSLCLRFVWTSSSGQASFESVCGESTYEVDLDYYDITSELINGLRELPCARKCHQWTDSTSTCVGVNICDGTAVSHYGCELLLRTSIFEVANCSAMNHIPGCTFYHHRTEVWPRGSYELTTPSLDCPDNWHPVTETIYMETGGYTDYSTGHHFQKYNATTSNDTLELHGCIKQSPFGTYDWPAGDYCILAYDCPQGFQIGYIRLDEEDDVSAMDIQLSFCCRSDGSWSDPINLPTSVPFYLYRYRGDCQEVTGMAVSEEYIHFDTEDTNNADEFYGSHALAFAVGTDYVDMRFCYYE